MLTFLAIDFYVLRPKVLPGKCFTITTLSPIEAQKSCNKALDISLEDEYLMEDYICNSLHCYTRKKSYEEDVSYQDISLDNMVKKAHMCEVRKTQAMITDYNAKKCGKDVIIPDEIDGKEVYAIGANAFSQMELRSVHLPKHLVFIENGAFQENALKEIILPAKTQAIGARAFQKNQLQHLELGKNLIFIGTNAFRDNGLVKLTLPQRIQEIGNYSFAENLITDLKLPKKLTEIPEGAFYQNQLQTVDLKYVADIEAEAFTKNAIKQLKLSVNTDVDDKSFDESVNIELLN